MDETPRRNDQKNNSSVWFALIIVGVLGLCMILLLTQTKRTIDYVDFKKLMAVTEFDETRDKLSDDVPEKGILEITEKGTDGRIIQYSQPNELVVSDQKITGRVKYRVVAGKGKSDQFRTVDFTTNKDNSDSTSEALEKMLSESNARWGYDSGPGAWEPYDHFHGQIRLVVARYTFELIYTYPSARDAPFSRMTSSA